MSNGFGLIIEILVAILLAMTVGYCMTLNRRLKLLKADESSLRATISELVTATEIAERAIAGLKLTVEECELGLGARLRSADRFTADLDRSVAGGKELLDRLTQIVTAGGGSIARSAGRKRCCGIGRAATKRGTAAKRRAGSRGSGGSFR